MRSSLSSSLFQLAVSILVTTVWKFWKTHPYTRNEETESTPVLPNLACGVLPPLFMLSLSIDLVILHLERVLLLMDEWLGLWILVVICSLWWWLLSAWNWWVYHSIISYTSFAFQDVHRDNHPAQQKNKPGTKNLPQQKYPGNWKYFSHFLHPVHVLWWLESSLAEALVFCRQCGHTCLQVLYEI